MWASVVKKRKRERKARKGERRKTQSRVSTHHGKVDSLEVRFTTAKAGPGLVRDTTRDSGEMARPDVEGIVSLLCGILAGSERNGGS